MVTPPKRAEISREKVQSPEPRGRRTVVVNWFYTSTTQARQEQNVIARGDSEVPFVSVVLLLFVVTVGAAIAVRGGFSLLLVKNRVICIIAAVLHGVTPDHVKPPRLLYLGPCEMHALYPHAGQRPP